MSLIWFIYTPTNYCGPLDNECKVLEVMMQAVVITKCEFTDFIKDSHISKRPQRPFGALYNKGKNQPTKTLYSKYRIAMYSECNSSKLTHIPGKPINKVVSVI